MVFTAGHLESYFEGPARLARRPLPLGRLVPPGLGVFFLLCFRVLFPSSVPAGIKVLPLPSAHWLKPFIGEYFQRRSKPLREVVDKTCLGLWGFALNTPPQLKLQFERK